MKKFVITDLRTPLYDKRGRKYKIYNSDTKTLKSVYNYFDEKKKEDKEKNYQDFLGR